MSYSVNPSSFQSMTSRPVCRYSWRSAFGSEGGTVAVCHGDRASLNCRTGARLLIGVLDEFILTDTVTSPSHPAGRAGCEGERG